MVKVVPGFRHETASLEVPTDDEVDVVGGRDARVVIVIGEQRVVAAAEPYAFASCEVEMPWALVDLADELERSLRGANAFAGRPDADRRGSEFDSARYRALGYGCSHGSSGTTWPLLSKGPYRRTVFWINVRTRRLGDFYTTSPRYSESHGVHIGMPTAAVEHILHQRVYVGCEENLAVGLLTVAFEGGVGRRTSGSPGLRLVGGHVYAFAVHGGRSDVGVFDCL